ncbi:hypothetical protein ABT032_49405, partial [Streptomyces flaveus]
MSAFDTTCSDMEYCALVSLRPADEPRDVNLTDAFGEASRRRCAESGDGLIPDHLFDFASLFAAGETRPLSVSNLCPDALRGSLRSRLSTDLGSCKSNGVPGRVIFRRYAHEGRAS